MSIPKKSKITLMNFTRGPAKDLTHDRQQIKTPSRGRPLKISLLTDEQQQNNKKGEFKQHLFLIQMYDMMQQDICPRWCITRKDVGSANLILV